MRLLATSSAARYNPGLDLWRVRLRGGRTVADVRAFLLSDPGVLLAQPNYIYTNADAPDDPLYLEKQHPYLATVNASAAWDVEGGDPDVIVAVVDGGVDTTHSELADRVWKNTGETIDGQDNDANGCIDDLTGCSFQETPPAGDVADRDGHGTFVAGIIAARSGNGQGVAGIAPGVTIMPVRALDQNGVGTTESLAGAVLYAARNGARVLNLSLALVPEGGTCPSDPIVDDAVRRARDESGAVLLAAAGNFDLPCVSFPAASEYAIAVAASGPPAHPDGRAFFSQWGPEVDVAAPGQDIVSTCPLQQPVPTSFCPGGPYGSGSGTSFSTPIAAGIAALLLSQDQGLTPAQIRDRLRSTARDLPDDQHPNWDGAGIVDAGAALGTGSAFAAVDVRAPPLSSLDVTVAVGDVTAPACRQTVWGRPAIAGGSLYGSFGVGRCAAFWPPGPSQPWWLRLRWDGRKAATLNAWSLRHGDQTCSASGVPILVPAGRDILFEITCDAQGLVANDTPEQAISAAPASLPRRFDLDTTQATSSGDQPSACATSFSRSVWYRLEPSGAPMDVAADTFGTGFDTFLAVYTGQPGALQEMACNDDFNVPQSRLVWRTDGVSAYYVMAAAFQGVPAGNLRLNLSPASIPPNDSIDGALSIAPGGPVPIVQPAHSATAAAADPRLSCATRYGHSLWFRVDASKGQHLTVSTEGSDYDTVIGVLARDAAGGLIPVACNDEAAPGVRTSAATWDAADGEYLIVVGAYQKHAGGTLKLHLTSE
jgi:subtilisin family serine protease